MNKFLKKQIEYNKKISKILSDDIKKSVEECRAFFTFPIWSDTPDINGISFTAKHIKQVASYNGWDVEKAREVWLDGRPARIAVIVEVHEGTLDLLKIKESKELNYKPLIDKKLFSANNKIKGLVRMRDIPDLE